MARFVRKSQLVVFFGNTSGRLKNAVTRSFHRSRVSCDEARQSASTSTIDDEEIHKFARLSKHFWDECGEMRPLHSMNALRVPFIRDVIVRSHASPSASPSRPLEGATILDVGCGAGILSEPLARLGATVCGIDAAEENIIAAKRHQTHDPDLSDSSRLTYIHDTTESLLMSSREPFDVVVASEVIEHVNNQDVFVESCAQLTKTRIAFALGVFAAERIAGIVAKGTHDWNKFIDPHDLSFLARKSGCTTRLIHGMLYNPFTNRWSWTGQTYINYLLHAVKHE